ncbi:MAG: hypothetical protein JW874_11885 [Spirochaetales bacterium]|nr:hypothetical protein [Spirochaetales bacterium]
MKTKIKIVCKKILLLFVVFTGGCISIAPIDRNSVYYEQGWKQFTVYWQPAENDMGQMRLTANGNETVVDAVTGYAEFSLPENKADSVWIIYINEKGREYEIADMPLDLDLSPPNLLASLAWKTDEEKLEISWEKKDAEMVYLVLSGSELSEKIEMESEASENRLVLPIDTVQQYTEIRISAADRYGNTALQDTLLVENVIPKKKWDPETVRYVVAWEKGIIPDGTLARISALDEVLDGKIALADSEQGKLLLIGDSGEILAETVTGSFQEYPFTVPQDLCRFSSEYFIALDKENSRVVFFDGELRQQSSFSVQTQRDDFRAVPQSVLYSDGNIYIADKANRVVRAYSAEGRQNAEIGRGILKSPFGLAAFSDGRLVVSDSELSVLFVFSSEGSLLERWGGFGPGKGRLLDPRRIRIFNDLLYVSDRGKEEIRMFSGQGKDLGSVFEGVPASAALSAADSILYMQNGMVIAGDSRNGILRLFDTEMRPMTDIGIFRTTDSFFIKEPECLAVAEDYLYILDTGRRQVIALDRYSGTYRFGFPSLQSDGPVTMFRPGGLAIGPDGDVYVSDVMLNTVLVYSTDGTYITRYDFRYESGEGFLPGRMAFSSRKGLLICSEKNNSVYALDLSAEQLLPRVFITGLDNTKGEIQAIAVSDDTVFLADRTSGEILYYDYDGLLVNRSGGFETGGPKAGEARDLAVDHWGNLYVCDQINRRIRKYNSSGYLGEISAGIRRDAFFSPKAICPAEDGFLYLADSGRKKIIACTPVEE